MYVFQQVFTVAHPVPVVAVVLLRDDPHVSGTRRVLHGRGIVAPGAGRARRRLVEVVARVQRAQAAPHATGDRGDHHRLEQRARRFVECQDRITRAVEGQRRVVEVRTAHRLGRELRRRAYDSRRCARCRNRHDVQTRAHLAVAAWRAPGVPRDPEHVALPHGTQEAVGSGRQRGRRTSLRRRGRIARGRGLGPGGTLPQDRTRSGKSIDGKHRDAARYRAEAVGIIRNRVGN